MPDPRTTPSGFTPLTRMPNAPSSAASSRTWWAWSAFDAPYATLFGPGEQGVLAHDVDDVPAHVLLDHDPGRLARDEERAARHDVVLEVPVVRRSSRAAACEIDRPALLTTRSTPPNASDGVPERRGDLPLVGHVARSRRRRRPARRARRATASALASSMSATTTQAPSAARRWRWPARCPIPPPVTNATRVASGFGFGCRASLASSSAQYSIRNFSDSGIGRRSRCASAPRMTLMALR